MKLVISAVLAAFFVFASSIKMFGWQKFIFNTQLAFFKKYGLNRAAMLIVGVIEMSGAVALWLPNLFVQLAGAAMLAATSLGAIYFHLRFDTYRDAIPAQITLILSLCLLFVGYA